MTMSRRPKLICYFKKISCKCGCCCCCNREPLLLLLPPLDACYLHKVRCVYAHSLLFTIFFLPHESIDRCTLLHSLANSSIQRRENVSYAFQNNNKSLEFLGSPFTLVPSWCLHSSGRLLLVSNFGSSKKVSGPGTANTVASQQKSQFKTNE